MLPLIALATTVSSQYLSPDEVSEGLKHPQQTYKLATPTPPRPILNKKDTEDLFKNLKKVSYPNELQFKSESNLSVPSSVDLRRFDSSIRDQKDLGYCTAFASIAVLENIAHRRNQILDLSEYQHFQDYKQYSMDAAAASAVKYLITPETSWPYKRSPITNWQSTRLARAKSEEYINDFDSLFSTLASGRPVLFGTTTNASWNSPLNGILKSTGAIGGGHAIAIVGYNKSSAIPYLIIRNSWTADWGDHGYGYLPMSYCSKYECYFISYSDTVIKNEVIPTPTPVKTPTAIPTPVPTPTPKSCNWFTRIFGCK